MSPNDNAVVAADGAAANDAPPAEPESFMQALTKAASGEGDGSKPKSVMWIVALLLSLYLMGVYDFLLRYEENGCAMTYMYEYPLYLPVSLPRDLQKRFPKYNLYVYAEGEEYERTIAEGQFSGIPVLFVPGNAGSYKQVRSLASVALRKAMEDDVGQRFHFDYFAVDFNEEFSALYGGSLQDQAEFAAHCVDHILGLYKRDPVPKSVVLVGHSIGGMVARAVFLQPGFDAAKVSTIVTLATPHKPVVVMDLYIKKFYDDVEIFWDSERTEGILQDLTFVSVGGGDRDVQVRAGLTASPHADVDVVTTGAPGVWVSTDHQCIAWCKQLVLAVNRALFDCVDRTTGQVTTKSVLRRQIFHYHLARRASTSKRYRGKGHFKKVVEFDKDGLWTERVERQFTFRAASQAPKDRDSHVMIRILNDAKHYSAAVEANGLDADSWIFACKSTTVHENTRVCETGDNLSAELTELLPSPASSSGRKHARFNLRELGRQGYTHVIVLVPKSSSTTATVMVDVHGEGDRSVSYEVPRWISFWKSHVVVPRTPSGAAFFNVSLQGVESPWQAYDVRVIPMECKKKEHFGLMRLVTPWTRNDVTQALILNNATSSSISARMQQIPKSDQQRPEVRLHLDPECRYRIEIQSSIVQMWGQMARFYSPMLLPLCTAVATLALAQQMKDMAALTPGATGFCPQYLSILSTRVTPISVVMPGRILGSLLSSTAAAAAILPATDFQGLLEDRLDFGVLPIVLFFVSMGLVSVVAYAAWASISVVGRAKELVLSPPSSNDSSDGIEKFPVALSCLLVAVAASTCGTVALCLGTFFLLLQMIYLYRSSSTGDDEASSSPNFQFSLLLIWVMASLLNAPSLLAWTNNLGFAYQRLQPDPSLMVAALMSASLAVTWGQRKPRKGLMYYDKLSYLLQFLCVVMVLYGIVSIYRVSHFLTIAVMAVALHQVLAPKQKTPKVKVDEASSPKEGNKADLVDKKKK